VHDTASRWETAAIVILVAAIVLAALVTAIWVVWDLSHALA
jgi:hypothetical protein